MKPREIPVTECWREAYEVLACKAELDFFPTRAYLKTNPEKSRQFCHWVWIMLGLQKGKIRGAKICSASRKACRDCQKQSLSKWTAMYVLAHIVRDEDPGLYMLLRKKCKQYQKGPSLKRRNDPPPHKPHDPLGPLAERMAVPGPLIFTDAVARELKDKPWVQNFL